MKNKVENISKTKHMEYCSKCCTITEHEVVNGSNFGVLKCTICGNIKN